jgi:hypothetical protein
MRQIRETARTEMEQASRDYRHFRDLLLFTLALPITWKARQIRSRSIEEVTAELSRWPGLLKQVDVGRAQCAAARACRILSRWTGTLDTCLTRSLVAGTLLADRTGVELHIGFKAPEGEDAVFDGHAWITVEGKCANEGCDSETQEDLFINVVSIPMSRAAR